MASRAHSATVRAVQCTPPFRIDANCGLCGNNVQPGAWTLPSGRVLSVTVGRPGSNPIVYLNCDPNSVFHEKCIEQWFIKGKTCPIHPCEVSLEYPSVEQVSGDSKSSEDPTAQTRRRSNSAAQEQLERAELYNYSDSESSDDLYS